MSDYRRITIAKAGEHTGEPVEIAGWLYNLRKSGVVKAARVSRHAGNVTVWEKQ